MQVRMAVVAEYVNETNDAKLNVLGIFDTVFASSFPATHAELRLVVSIEFAAAECGTERELTVDFIDQDGKSVVRISQPFSVPPSTNANRQIKNTILVLRGLPIPHGGMFEFYVLMNDNEIVRVPLLAALREPVAGGSATTN